MADSHRPEMTEAAREPQAEQDERDRALSPSEQRSLDWTRENYPTVPALRPKLTRGKGWRS